MHVSEKCQTFSNTVSWYDSNRIIVHIWPEINELITSFVKNFLHIVINFLSFALPVFHNKLLPWKIKGFRLHWVLRVVILSWDFLKSFTPFNFIVASEFDFWFLFFRIFTLLNFDVLLLLHYRFRNYLSFFCIHLIESLLSQQN